MNFVDTNVLLYSISTDPAEDDKRQAAQQLLERHDLVLSVQVLQEFYVQSTRESRSDRISHETATGLISAWQRYPVVPVNTDHLFTALDLRARYKWSYWDSAIVAAALSADCRMLLSEDLGDGQKVGQLLIRNPFRAG